MRESEGGGRRTPPNDGTEAECTDPLTDRLWLSPVSPADAEEMAGVLAAPELYTWTGGRPPTVAALESLYGVWAISGARPVAGRRFDRTWVLRLRGGNEAVGFAQATVTADRSTAVLAWVIGVAWQRRGFATEAALRLAEVVRSEGVPVLRAHIAAGHVASERVAAALGMVVTDRVVGGERLWEAAAP